MEFNRVLDQPVSNDPITEFIQKHSPQISSKLIHQNQYFQIVKIIQTKNPQNLTFHQALIQPKGLINHYSIPQLYRRLNPFDYAVVKRMSQQNTPVQKTTQNQKLQKIVEPQTSSITSIHENKSIQNIQPQSSNSLPPLSNEQGPITKDTSYSQKKNPKEQTSQNSNTNAENVENSNITSFSLWFLYFIKKLINSEWKYHQKQGDTEDSMCKWVQNFLAQQLQQKMPVCSRQLLKAGRLMKVSEAQTQKIKQQDMKILMKTLRVDKCRKYNEEIHEFFEWILLYYLYKMYSISNDWTERVQGYIKKVLEKEKGTVFEKAVNDFVKHIKIRSHVRRECWGVEKQIQKVFESRGLNLQEMNANYELAYPDGDDLPPSKRIINMLINNLHRFNYQSQMRTQQMLKALEGSSINREKHINLLVRKEKNQLLRSSLWGLVNEETEYNRAIFFDQLVNLKELFSTRQNMLSMVLSVVNQLGQFLSNLNHQQIFTRFALLQITGHSFIWNPWKKRVEFDKLEWLKLIYGLESNPKLITQDLTQLNIRCINRSKKSLMNNFLDQMVVEIQMRGKESTDKLSVSNRQLKIIPFVRAAIAVYQIWNKKDTKEQNQHQPNNQQNLSQKQNLQNNPNSNNDQHKLYQFMDYVFNNLQGKQQQINREHKEQLQQIVQNRKISQFGRRQKQILINEIKIPKLQAQELCKKLVQCFYNQPFYYNQRSNQDNVI